MAAGLITTQNLNSFTTTAGTEAAVAAVYIPYDVPVGQGVTLSFAVYFTTVNAATTQLDVRVRQATFSGGHVVVSSPAGTLIGTAATSAFTAGTLSATAISGEVYDPAPALVSSADTAVPSQIASLDLPGQILQGAGYLYVLTVKSTTNTAVVAAAAATLTAFYGSAA
jgi:hypothetical protein